MADASLFSAPATTKPASAAPQPVRPVLDPFSTFAQGEGVLRQQLSALSRDHLLAVIGGYELPVDVKASVTDRALIEDIVQAVHQLTHESPTA